MAKSAPSRRLVRDREKGRYAFTGPMHGRPPSRPDRNWSQQDLAHQAGIGTVAVHQLENETSSPRRATLDVVRRAFEGAGVEFIDENGGGAGVRLRKALS